MRRFVLLLSFSFVVLLANGQFDLSFDVSQWKRIEALDKSCTIYAPLQMTVRVDSVDTEIGEIMTVQHLLQQSTEFTPNFMFNLTYTRYPQGVISLDSTAIIEDVLRTTFENSSLKLGGDLIYYSDIDYKDLPGKIWKIKYGDGQYMMKSKAFVDDDRLYLVQVASLAEFASNRAVDHFFDSFKVLDPQDRN